MHCHYDPVSKAIWRLWKELRLSPLFKVLSGVVVPRSKVLRGCDSVFQRRMQISAACELSGVQHMLSSGRWSVSVSWWISKSVYPRKIAIEKRFSQLPADHAGPRAAVTISAPLSTKSKRPRKSKSSETDPWLRGLVKAGSKVTLSQRQNIYPWDVLLTLLAAAFVCKCQRNE